MEKPIQYSVLIFALLLLFQCNKPTNYKGFINKFCGAIVTPCGSKYILDYNDLPEVIKINSTSEILKLIRKDDIDLNIKFAECQIIDSCEFVRNYNWEFPTYRMKFEWIMENKLIDYYCFSISLDSRGKILERIDLPNFKANENRMDIISKDEFDSILIANKFQYFDDVEIRFDTLRKIVFFDLSIWDTWDNSCLITVKDELHINAHNGEIIKN